MKKIISSLLLTFLITTAFSQSDSIKKFPLKDYIAPEINYRTLELGSSLQSAGTNHYSDGKVNSFRFNGNLNYYEYKNMQRHQGISRANFRADFSSTRYKMDEEKNSSTWLGFDFNYWTQNRLYFKEKKFWGIHGNLSYHGTPINKRKGEDNIKLSENRLIFAPFVSMGKGRIQPVESARKAMDILIALEKNKRLALTPDNSVIDSLARVVNKIRFKRFYDNRYKNIYQLEELDKAIQDLGLVDSLDIVYFANLNDIWIFAPNYNRGSGTRFEGGIIPTIQYSHSKYNDEDISNTVIYNNTAYGFFGFFSFNRMKPINYTWQSDLMVDLTLGYGKDKQKYEDDGMEPYEESANGIATIINASWQFGYYPNTRTFAGITPYLGVSNTQNFETDKFEFGINTGMDFMMYYYVSPRLRFVFQANLSYYDNYALNVPTPFWNRGSGTNVANILTFLPNDIYERGNKRFSYSAVVSLNYAIF